MKLKFYLRGIGVGIIVTFLILFFTRQSNNQLSDEEIKLRAKELGMIENATLSDSASGTNTLDDKDKKNNSVSSSQSQSNNSASSNSLSSNSASDNSADDLLASGKDENDKTDNKGDGKEENIEDNKEDNNKEDSNKEDNNKEDNDTDNEDENEESDNDSTESVSITIIAGDSSYTAAKKLQTAGIIESAAKFDEYMCRNGYDKYLVVGTHTIPKNATEKEIAIIITSRNN